MTRLRRSKGVICAVAVACAIGCNGNHIGTLKPTTHFKTQLLRPLLHDAEPIMADINVPNGYHMQPLMGPTSGEAWFSRESPRANPEISLVSLGVLMDASPNVTAPVLYERDCSRGSDSGSVQRNEARSDGWVVVCSLHTQADDDLLEVVRRVRWEGNEYQCDVAFLNVTPTSKQIDDAIAICDSFKLRAMTADEGRESWNGTTWVTAPK